MSENQLVEIGRSNPSIIEEGLIIIQEEMKTPSGIIDALCKDREGNWVVVEYKIKADDSAVGQIFRYMGYVRDIYNGKHVRGIIYCYEYDPKIAWSMKLINESSYFNLRCQEVDFTEFISLAKLTDDEIARLVSYSNWKTLLTITPDSREPPTRKIQQNKRGSFFMVLPKDVIRAIGWQEGANIEFLIDETGIRLRPKGDPVNCENRPKKT